jgi:LPXTG-motif cell wall-anchored protein
MRKMIRLGAAVGATLMTLVLTALPVLAQAQQYPPEGPAETDVVQGPAAEEVAFTGSDVTLLMVLIGVLVVAGVAALMLARRRAAAVNR